MVLDKGTIETLIKTTSTSFNIFYDTIILNCNVIQLIYI